MKDSNRRLALFSSADTDATLYASDEDLAVTDLTSLRGSHDRLDHVRNLGVSHHNLQLDLRQEVDCVFVATVDFGVAFLSPEAFDFGNGHTLDPYLVEGFFRLFQF